MDVTPQDAPYTEWLTYAFDDRQPASAKVSLTWIKKEFRLALKYQTSIPYTYLKCGMSCDQLLVLIIKTG
ncbi:MAG: hypothetical protein IPJ20_20470 [Flammeovirgaceae bacterium]|nr:hypothetical protein [Flammeovirgaceae bacterium]